MAGMDIGASVGRKEDERFLRGRGQYVGDFRIPGAREGAFVRSSVAHGFLRSITIPEKHRGMVVTAERYYLRQTDQSDIFSWRLKVFAGADPGRRQGGPVLPGIERLADDQNPNLTAWASAQVRMHNELVKKDIALSLPNHGAGPGGTPGRLLFLQPLYFIQAPQEV
jgi:hypothetical protein